jgi:hypothetical protein
MSAPSSLRQAINPLEPKIAYSKVNYKRDIAFIIILAKEVNKGKFLHFA